jgi:hypothetical protein
MSRDGMYRDPSTVPPSLLVESSRTLETVTPCFQNSLLEYNTCIQGTSRGVHNGDSGWLCRCRRKKRQSSNHRGWMTSFSEEVHLHDPRFAHAEYSRLTGIQFSVYSRLFGVFVQAGWQRTRGGWKTSIAPVLRYRAVVSSQSPVFKLLDSVSAKLSQFLIECKPSQQEMSNVLTATSRDLLRCFDNDARPTDLDQNGNGIFYVCIQSLLMHTGLMNKNRQLFSSSTNSLPWGSATLMLHVCSSRRVSRKVYHTMN